MTGFNLTDLNTLVVDLGKAPRVGALAAAVVRRSALQVEREAKQFCPVDTGNLRSSISTTVEGDGRFAAIGAEIGPTAEYGIWVEYGTSRQAPAAFMGPAFDRAQPAFVAAMEQVGTRIL